MRDEIYVDSLTSEEADRLIPECVFSTIHIGFSKDGNFTVNCKTVKKIEELLPGITETLKRYCNLMLDEVYALHHSVYGPDDE